MPDVEYLFVYGTLRSGGPRAADRERLMQGAVFVDDAAFPGRLYRIGWYPGAVRGTETGARVHGEVYRMGDPRAALARLDDYEGDEYTREVVTVDLAGGGMLDAWVYLYARPTGALQPIASGDFLKPEAG